VTDVFNGGVLILAITAAAIRSRHAAVGAQGPRDSSWRPHQKVTLSYSRMRLFFPVVDILKVI
jgi:hypothetical protein